ncbi:hypothetical protein DMUE_2060 [Dictyocoela muelleri]|nr:hypothetical protein DMUE_2060 [Dictyocoela muelleri]
MVENHFYNNKIFHCLDAAVEYFLMIHAVQNSINCPKRTSLVPLKKQIKSETFIYIYRCSKRNCIFSQTLLSKTTLNSMKIDIPAILFTVYLAMFNISNDLFKGLFSFNEKTFSRIKNKLNEIYKNIINGE